ncbi:MAG TPA: glycoside hydrolase family 71/99-like protein [Bdellovibrionales bacterium]|nr:glycoside hydrolase family 71/99-like protein [Bdellovibrionales bacterium]
MRSSRSKVIAVCLMLAAAVLARPERAAAQANFRDLVFAGYQGWFAAPGDGSLETWDHWNKNQTPQKGRVTFELFPDLREYQSHDLFPTGLGLIGGKTPAALFSSDREGVINTHFKWMAEYGIDGVGLQRFVNEISSSPRHLKWRNGVAAKVRKYSEIYKRYFYVTYDLSGANAQTLVQDIQRDFENELTTRLGVFRSPFYARQGGRPVIGLWGLGFRDRPVTIAQAQTLIRWFQQKGFFVMGGVPWHWQQEKPWHDTFFMLNMVQPWGVGAYATLPDVDHHAQNIWHQDRLILSAKGVDYQRVIFPGFAWSNWNGGARNMIPRRGGEFLWRQAVHVAAQRMSAFIAMFDEYDEGTAIAKAAEDASMIPADQYFLTLDADGIKMDSDFYLRLSGAATLMIKGQRSVTTKIPVPYRKGSL